MVKLTGTNHGSASCPGLLTLVRLLAYLNLILPILEKRPNDSSVVDATVKLNKRIL